MPSIGFTRTNLALAITAILVVLALIGLKVFSSYFASNALEGETVDKTTVKIFYVNACDQIASDQNNGGSWQSPLETIQRAVDLTTDNPIAGQTTQVWVASCPDYQENLAINSKPHLEIYGGFTGKETSLAELKAENRTAINIKQGSVLRLDQADFVTISNLVFKGGLTAVGLKIAKSKNIVIKNVDIESFSLSDGEGAGLNITDSQVAISQTSFRFNLADSGAALAASKSSLSIVGSSFDSNQASQNGGALSIVDGGLALKNSLLTNNRSLTATESGGGGAIYARNLTDGSLISRSYLYKNTAKLGSALLIDASATEITNNVIAANSGELAPIAVINQTAVKFYNNTIAGNQAKQGNGAFWAGSSSTPSLVNNIFANNTGAKAAVGRDEKSSYKSLANLDFYQNSVGSIEQASDLNLCLDCLELNPAWLGGDQTSSLFYQLTVNSPLLGRGKDLTTVVDDYLGNPRPVGVNDIGAFELKR